MIDFGDPSDPNHDPYWDDETDWSGELDYVPIDDSELEGLEEQYIREMREEGLLRPTLVEPDEKESKREPAKPIDNSDVLSF